MTTEEIERRFAALDERIAQVDAAIARVRELTAATNARLLALEERGAAEVQVAADALDDLGERVGHLESAAALPLPWMMAGDGSRWTALLPDGSTAMIERLDDGVSFLPRVGDAVGPVCAGVLGAAAWCAEYAA